MRVTRRARALFGLDYTYLGRVSADPRVIVTGPTSEYGTIQELLSGSDVTFATAGTGGADHIDATEGAEADEYKALLEDAFESQ